VKPVANGIAIAHRKKSASPHAIRSAHASTVIGSRTGPRRALGIAAQPAKRGYRPDLRKVSVQYALPFRTYLLQKIRILVRTHRRRLNVMKDGRGHVCKINPSPDGADQTPLRCRHTLSELVRRKARVADELAMTLLVPPPPPLSLFSRILFAYCRFFTDSTQSGYPRSGFLTDRRTKGTKSTTAEESSRQEGEGCRMSAFVFLIFVKASPTRMLHEDQYNVFQCTSINPMNALIGRMAHGLVGLFRLETL